jgi:hypothetical protein
VDNGCQTEDQLQESDREGYQKMMKLKEARWRIGLAMYSKIEELLEHV